MSLKIFISHSVNPKNMELITSLEQQLPENIDLYIAERDKKPGHELKNKIEENLITSDIVLALLTKEGENNAWVNQEIGLARGNKIPIIPIRQKGVKVKGFTEGVEWIPLDMRRKDKAIEAVKQELIKKYNEKVERIRAKEAEDFRNMMFVIIGLIAVVVILAVVASRK